jgi:hypothetical protein
MGIFYYEYEILFSDRDYLNKYLYIFLLNNIYDILYDEVIYVDLDSF